MLETCSEERSPPRIEIKGQTKNGFYKKSLSMTPERTFFRIKLQKSLNNYENMMVTSKTKQRYWFIAYYL